MEPREPNPTLDMTISYNCLRDLFFDAERLLTEKKLSPNEKQTILTYAEANYQIELNVLNAERDNTKSSLSKAQYDFLRRIAFKYFKKIEFPRLWLEQKYNDGVYAKISKEIINSKMFSLDESAHANNFIVSIFRCFKPIY